MKCFILAGGTGDSLWPLSRQKYPKQFMYFHENRSLFQEAVARNITFCDEFYIITNAEFRYIAEVQLKAFQGIRYQLILEEDSKKTAPAIIMAAMLTNPEEDVLLVTADHLILGDGYREDVIRSKSMLQEHAAVLHGIRPVTPSANLTYIRQDGEQIVEYSYKPEMEQARKYTESGMYLCNTGLTFFCIEKYLQMVKRVNSFLYATCEKAALKAERKENVILLHREFVQDIPAIAIDKAVYIPDCQREKQDILFQECSYEWIDIGSLLIYDKYKRVADGELCIENNCSDVTVINRSRDRLVVVNDLKDAIVVSTEDAIYVSSKDRAEDIKRIVQQNHDSYRQYFDYNRVQFRSFGIHELVYSSENYRVKKITLYPGTSTTFHKHEYRMEQWTVVKGVATITLQEEQTNFYQVKDYKETDAVTVSVGMAHRIENRTRDNVEIMEISVGKKLMNSDIIMVSGEKETDFDEMVKLSPAFKDYLWGGTRLKDDLGKKCDLDIVAESWELSAHPDGLSRVASGRDKGVLFNDYLDRIGKENLGWKCQHYDRFPILIKFIDAANPLSIQIHPDDDYALEHEGEYGKNEMWYIMDCEEGAYIYFGTKYDISKEELRKRIEDNTVLEVLNKVYVKKGDTFFVKAGTIHAICGGILICEIQQNSNCTYRMYDYGRRDKSGNLRELHIDKAVDVVKTKQDMEDTACTEVEASGGEILSCCKYFECVKYEVQDHMTLKIDDSSFVSIMVVEGNGRIEGRNTTLDVKYGDSVFIPAQNSLFDITGECQIIVTHV